MLGDPDSSRWHEVSAAGGVLEGVFNDRVWVFAAATTNVEYTLRVTDTDSGEVREYTNPLGVASPAVTDTDAFASCQ